MIRYRLLLGAVFLAVAGCAATDHRSPSASVEPGHKYAGGYINITAPNSSGWSLIQSTPAGMVFAKRGPATDESFVAQVSMFYLAPTRTPQEFEALIEQTAKKDIDRTRFAVEQLTFASSDERSYPCVRTSYIVQDKAPQGMKNPLLLQTDALYCRHPKRPTTGFAISYSHRGESLDPSLGAEAQQFIAGAQVPE